jgi:hypothetical protein
MIKVEKLNKRTLARYVEEHHLYTGEYGSKRYYKYDSDKEIAKLMKMPKKDLIDMFTSAYWITEDGIEERTASEMLW